MYTTTSDDVRLWWELRGEGPVLTLVPGRGDSADGFPGCFVDAVIAAGYSVLRYDPRDTGLSGDGGDEYTLSAMASDVVSVMDAAAVERSHVVAFSMGGLQLVDLATLQPDRVRCAIFLAAMSPDPRAGMGPAFFDGLEVTDAVVAILAGMGAPSGQDREWVAAELARSEVRAPLRPDAGQRHMDASLRFGWPSLDALQRIAAPTLVVHGDADQVLPLAHADAFARHIARAERHVLRGMGHLPTRAEWDVIAELVVSFASRWS